MRARLLSNEQGYMVTSTVLTISAILAILLAGMTGLAVASFQIAAYNNARTEALYVAESGINYALWNLNTYGTFTPSPDYVDIESGHSRYKVEPLEDIGSNTKRIVVRGEVKTGYGSGWTHRTIEITAEKPSLSPSFPAVFEYAIITDTDLSITGANVTVSSASSPQGFGFGCTGNNGNVHSNGDIIISGSNVEVCGKGSAVGEIQVPPPRGSL